MPAATAPTRGAEAPPRARRGERGFTLVLLIASIAIMLIVMGAGASTWRYIMKNDREEELFFRGSSIAGAIEDYQKKSGGAYPPDLKTLVDRHFLRKLYADPMTRSGKWRLLRPGEAITCGSGVPLPGASARPSPGPFPPAGPPGGTGLAPMGASGTTLGALVGVVSTSRDTSLREYNGCSRYDGWAFVAGQPRRLGKDARMPVVPGPGGPGRPGGLPSARP